MIFTPHNFLSALVIVTHVSCRCPPDTAQLPSAAQSNILLERIINSFYYTYPSAAVAVEERILSSNYVSG